VTRFSWLSLPELRHSKRYPKWYDSTLFAICAVALFGAASATPASACEDGHWIDEVMADGQILRLEDGSLWKVEPVDAVTSTLRLPVSDVIVCDDKIVNVDDGETVHARRLR
jgi:hypothetical protein